QPKRSRPWPRENPADACVAIFRVSTKDRSPGARPFAQCAPVFVSRLRLVNRQWHGKASSTKTSWPGKILPAPPAQPAPAPAGSFVAILAQSSRSSLQPELSVIVRQNPRRLHVDGKLLQIGML